MGSSALWRSRSSGRELTDQQNNTVPSDGIWTYVRVVASRNSGLQQQSRRICPTTTIALVGYRAERTPPPPTSWSHHNRDPQQSWVCRSKVSSAWCIARSKLHVYARIKQVPRAGPLTLNPAKLFYPLGLRPLWFRGSCQYRSQRPRVGFSSWVTLQSSSRLCNCPLRQTRNRLDLLVSA